MIVELDADQKGCIDFETTLYRPEAVTEIIGDGIVRLSGELSSGVDGVQGVRYALYAATVTSGGTCTSEDTIRVSGADKAWIVLSAATSYFEGDKYDRIALEKLNRVIENADERNFHKMHKASVKEYKKLYDRVELKLASDSGTENYIAGLPWN